MKWITSERPKIDRIACPRLIARFIDKDAECGRSMRSCREIAPIIHEGVSPMSPFLPRALAALALLTGGTGIAQAASGVVRHGADGPSPILTGVTVPAGAETLYLSGQVPPVVDAAVDPATPAAYGDTRTQTVGIFRKIEGLLAAQGYGLKDVVTDRISGR